MVDFKDLATQYVLSDDDLVMRQAAQQAAAAIQDAAKDPASTRGVTANWVQSVNDWYPGSSTVADVDDGEEAESPDVILRAKALGFLAATLEALPGNVLNGTQVQLLVHFFSVMFDADHKAGILAATKALRYLISMSSFKPQLADSIIGNVSKIGDDFRLQPPATRLEVYELLHGLIREPTTRGELQHIHGSTSGFILDLLRMCQHERDPRNLLEWFAILKTLLENYSMSPDVLQEVFKTFSSYFPISIRSSATPAAITTEQLKLAVRGCFASNYHLADLAFPFLVQKLDQGDSVTVGVKLDILSTIQACIEQYSHVQQGIVPFVSQIWNSLKYEVRNGEIQASIQATLDVMSAISKKFSRISHQGGDLEELQSFVNLVMGDCLDDFSNPTYTKNAGQLATAVLASDIRAFSLLSPKLIDSLWSNIRQPKSPQHTRDLLGLLNAVLKARQALLVDRESSDASLMASTGFQVPENVLDDIYVRLWRENTAGQLTTEQVAVLKEVITGLALLIGQQSTLPDGTCQRAYDDARCREICTTLSHRIVNSLVLSSAGDSNLTTELEREAVLALQKAVTAYPQGFGFILSQAMKTVRSRDWRGSPSQRSVKALTELGKRLAYIGCSELPHSPSPLLNFVGLTGAWLQILHLWLQSKVDFQITIIALQGILSAMLNFRNAASKKTLADKGALRTPLDMKDVAQEVLLALPTFPRIDDNAVDMFKADELGLLSQFDLDLSEPQRGYLKLSLFICSQLYRRATKVIDSQNGGSITLGLSSDFTSAGAVVVDAEDAYMHQLAGMATFIIRDLDGVEQDSLHLQDEVFALFRTENVEPLWSDADEGRTNILSMGILRALRPVVVSKLPGGALTKILGDKESFHALHERSQIVRDGMACVIANKYLPEVTDVERTSWAEVMASLTTALTPGYLKEASLEMISRILFVVAGAITRRDRPIEKLSNAIAHAPVQSAKHGLEIARSMEVLVSTKDFLNRENHAVIKPTYRQWAYHAIVQPILKLAFPFQPADQASTTYMITVLTIVKHLVFDIYSADAEDLARITIAGLSRLQNQYDIEAACLILLDILDKKPELLQGHIKAIVDGTYGVYTTSTKTQVAAQGEPQVSARFLRSGSPSKCRKAAMKILELLPQKFDTGLLLPYAANLRRGLKIASGDSVRYIRPDVQAARKAWDTVI